MTRRSLALAALAVALIALVALADTHVVAGNLWTEIFGRVPIERVLVLFKDGDCFVITSEEPHRVEFPTAWMFGEAKKKPGDILLIIHNHTGVGRFSPQDKALYRRLRGMGFTGRFLLLLPTGTVLEYAEI